MRKGRLELLLLLCAAVVLGLPAFAQSGRRREKVAPPLPAPQEIAQPPAGPPPSTPPAEVKAVVAAAHLDHDSAYLSSNYVETALKAVTERLKEHGLPNVSAAGSMKRQEALERAKGGPGQYVVWLNIRVTTAPLVDDITRVDYFVFTPQTGQLLFTGKVVPPNKGRGPVIMGIPTSGRADPKAQLKWAGRHIADLVNRRLRP